MKTFCVFVIIAAALSTVCGTDCQNEVVGFQVYDKKNKTRTMLTPPIATINLSDYDNCMLSFIALTSSKPASCTTKKIQCVKLARDTQRRTENRSPYTFYGDVRDNNRDDIRVGTPDFGLYNLTACLYTDTDCSQGRVCKDLPVNVYGGDITGFNLYSAKTNSLLAAIKQNSLLCLPSDKANIEATTVGRCIYSVELDLKANGNKIDERTELEAPYFVCGNNGGDVFPCDTSFKRNTKYSIKADGGGKSLEYDFSFKNCAI